MIGCDRLSQEPLANARNAVHPQLERASLVKISTHMDVIQFDLAATNNVQVTLQSAAFTPELGVIGSPCSSSTTCIIDQTIAAPGTVGPVQVPQNSPAGSYFIFVTNVADAACGAYNVSLTGTLPVKLENFSVE